MRLFLRRHHDDDVEEGIPGVVLSLMLMTHGEAMLPGENSIPGSILRHFHMLKQYPSGESIALFYCGYTYIDRIQRMFNPLWEQNCWVRALFSRAFWSGFDFPLGTCEEGPEMMVMVVLGTEIIGDLVVKHAKDDGIT